MPLTIKPTARGILRRQVLAQLSGIGDIHIALADGQWATAQTLRRRYENCLRLLDDLGWREDDPADECAITMEPVPLMRVLARLHERASEEESSGGGGDRRGARRAVGVGPDRRHLRRPPPQPRRRRPHGRGARVMSPSPPS